MNKIRTLYDNMPYYLKDSASMPFAFDELSHDQQHLLMMLYDGANPHEEPERSGEEIREELTAIVAELESLIADIRE